MSITDHPFIPQSRTSNMCVCGEAMSSHGDPTPVVTSFQPMATTHMRTCDAYRRTLRAEVVLR